MVCEFCSKIENFLCCKKNSKVDEDENAAIPLKFCDGHKFDEMEDLNANMLKKVPNLPTEMIIEIIKYLNDIEDIKSCMLLSKSIRNSIFKTPKIMRSITISINCPESIKLLETKGTYIRCLKLKNPSLHSLKSILKSVPNLEELNVKNILQESSQLDIQEVENLKILELNSTSINSFIKVKKLIKFTAYITEIGHEIKISNFIANQKFLKELKIINISNQHIQNFPYNFKNLKLKSLKIIRIKLDGYFDNFLTFMLDTLEELDVTEISSIKTIEIIFKKSKKLKKLTIGCAELINNVAGLRIESLQHFEHKDIKGVKLDKIYEIFPNLKSLKCLKLLTVDGCFDAVEELDIFVLDCRMLRNLRMNGLKILKICKILRFFDENDFEEFVKNTGNVEELTIKHVEDVKNIPKILKCLKNYKNLINFKIKIASYYDDYEITISIKDKIVKTLRTTVEKNQEILKVLHDNFEDFEFFEFKNFIGKIKKFDIVVQLDKH